MLRSCNLQHKISDLKYKIAAIVYCAKITNIINAGYGRHKILLGQEEYGNANSEMMYSLVWGNISTAVCKISAAILLHRAVEITTFRVCSILLTAFGSVVSLAWIVLLETTCIPSRLLPKIGVAGGGGYYLIFSISRICSTDGLQCYQFYSMFTLQVMRPLSYGRGMLLSKKGWLVVLFVGRLPCKLNQVVMFLGWRIELTWIVIELYQWLLSNARISRLSLLGMTWHVSFPFGERGSWNRPMSNPFSEGKELMID